MRVITILAAVFIAPTISDAQTLRLTNSSEATIVMKYLPTNQRQTTRTMRVLEIPPATTEPITTVTLRGDDPYDVSFSQKGAIGENQEVFALVAEPIRLKALAGQGPFDVRLVFAARESPNGTIIHLGGAWLGDNRVEVSSPNASSGTAFTKQVLKHRWDTTVQFEDGSVNGATIQFDKLTFQTSEFTGRFTELTVFQDPQGCHIVGTWEAVGTKGDVFFTIDRRNPAKIKGDYTVAGKQGRYFWNSRQ